MEKQQKKMVQVFGKKKNSIAVATCTEGKGLLKINGVPITLLQPEIMRTKAQEAIYLLGASRFAKLDIRIRVQGGGSVGQVYAIRQAIAKAILAYYQKYVDEQSKRELKAIIVNYDRGLLVADHRRREPKKFGGPSARSRKQKSYR